MIVLTCFVPEVAPILPQCSDGFARSVSGPIWMGNGGTVASVGGYTVWQQIAIDPDDDKAYGRTVAQYWNLGFDHLLILEPDIEMGPSTVFDFRACQHPYCAAPYPWLTDSGPALGCTRFRKEFMARYPAAITACGEVGYRQFDVVLMRKVLLGEYGEQPHVHAPVIHHNPLKQLLPDANPEPMEHVPAMFGNVE